MKLTPLDIHHKEFRRSIRGYDDKEVDDFLDAVADEFERLFKENIDLSERFEATSEKVRSYQQIETTLHNTLVSAQRSAEEIVATAREEAAGILRDAGLKAKEVIHDALTQKQRMTGELVRIKEAEEQFRTRFARMLEEYQATIREVPLPDDVSVLLGRTEEGTVSDVRVSAESALAALGVTGAAATVVAAVEPGLLFPAEPAPDPTDAAFMSEAEATLVSAAGTVSADQVREPSSDDDPPHAVATSEVEAIEGAWVSQPVREAEHVPEPGFVTGVTLGEIDPPTLLGDLEIETPREFEIRPADSLGEREDDIDIEEID
ncbi:MAG TPA: DivIVA domain-containing protein [Coriobacteriia bacterium]|nr:DivIVA domain-containing protein [Coriobacteriia bacterium]